MRKSTKAWFGSQKMCHVSVLHENKAEQTAVALIEHGLAYYEPCFVNDIVLLDLTTGDYEKGFAVKKYLYSRYTERTYVYYDGVLHLAILHNVLSVLGVEYKRIDKPRHPKPGRILVAHNSYLDPQILATGMGINQGSLRAKWDAQEEKEELKRQQAAGMPAQHTYLKKPLPSAASQTQDSSSAEEELHFDDLSFAQFRLSGAVPKIPLDGTWPPKPKTTAGESKRQAKKKGNSNKSAQPGHQGQQQPPTKPADQPVEPSELSSGANGECVSPGLPDNSAGPAQREDPAE